MAKKTGGFQCAAESGRVIVTGRWFPESRRTNRYEFGRVERTPRRRPLSRRAAAPRDRETRGSVDETYYVGVKKGVVEARPVVTVNANGATVGRVYVRRDRCGLTDDVIAVDVTVSPRSSQIDLDYLAVALQGAVARGGFLYEAKLFATRVRELEIEILVLSGGAFDLTQQQAIATTMKRFESLRTRLRDLGERTADVRAV